MQPSRRELFRQIVGGVCAGTSLASSTHWFLLESTVEESKAGVEVDNQQVSFKRKSFEHELHKAAPILSSSDVIEIAEKYRNMHVNRNRYIHAAEAALMSYFIQAKGADIWWSLFIAGTLGWGSAMPLYGALFGSEEVADDLSRKYHLEEKTIRSLVRVIRIHSREQYEASAFKGGVAGVLAGFTVRFVDEKLVFKDQGSNGPSAE